MSANQWIKSAWVRRTALGVLVLMAAFALFALAMTQAPGRWLVSGLVDGRAIGAAGNVRIEGLSGNMLGRFSIDRLSLHDGDGVWLSAEGVDIRWSPVSLVDGPVQIQTLSIERILVERRPTPQARTTPVGHGRAPELDLHRLSVTHLTLAPGVLGAGSVFAINGTARFAANTIDQLALEMVRLDQAGDRLDMHLARSVQGVINGDFNLTGSPNGPFTTLLQLPGSELALTGTLAGTVAEGAGRLRLTADNHRLGEGQLDWQDNQWTLTSDLDLAMLEALDPRFRSIFRQPQLTASGPLVPRNVETLQLSVADAQLQARRAAADSWSVNARAGEQVLSFWLAGQAEIAALSLEGEYLPGPTRRFDGQILIDGIEHEAARITTLAGTIELALPTAGPRLELDLEARGVGFEAETARHFFTENATFFVRAGRDGSTTQIDTFRIDTGVLTAQGQARIGTRVEALDSRIRISDLSNLSDALAGGAALDIRTSGSDGFALQLDASMVEWPDAYQQLASGLRLETGFVPGPTGWSLRDAVLATNAGEMTLSGLYQTLTDWSITGDGALVLDIDNGQVRGDGVVALAVALTASEAGLSGRAAFTTPELHFAGQSLSTPTLDLRGQMREGLSQLDWGFTSSLGGQPVQLRGTLDLANDHVDVRLASGEIGAWRGTSRLDLDGGAISAELAAAAEPYGHVNLNYSGHSRAVLEGRVEIDARSSALQVDALRLEPAVLRLTGPLSGMAFEGEVQGHYEAPFDFDFIGLLDLANDPARAELNLSGLWGEHRLSSNGPLVLSSEYQALLGVIGIDDGEISFFVSPTRMTANARRAPFSILGLATRLPGLGGQFDAEIALASTHDHWAGYGRVVSTDLHGSDLPDSPHVSVDAAFSVDGTNQLALDLTGETIRLQLVLEDDGSALAGNVRMNGDVETLAALVLPASTTISGGIIANIDIGGSREQPALSGTVDYQDGIVTAASSGTNLHDIAVSLELEGHHVDILTARATDGRTGVITASGEFDLIDGRMDGAVVVDARSVRLVRRSDIQATVSGETRLSADETGWHISGSSNLDRLDLSPAGGGGAPVPDLAVVEINLPAGRKPGPRRVLPISLDYRVTAQNGVLVAGRGFASEWGVDFHATGKASAPQISGEANLIAGTAFLVNRRFVLQRGVVSLDGDLTDAQIDLAARHVRRDLTVDAHVEGLVASPSLTFTSEPELPEDEIFSRLLFDRAATALSPFEAAQMATQLSGHSIIGLVGNLRDLAGVDQLLIGGGDNGELTVTAGRRLGENLYVEVESGLAVELGSTRVEWALTPEISLLSRLSGDTDASVSLRWRREYD